MTSEMHYDELLYPVLTSEGNIIGFFDKIFDFLYRRTDFFKIKKDESSKIGLEPGEAENIVRSVFCKYVEQAVIQNKLETQNELEPIPLDVVAEEVVTTDEINAVEEVPVASESVPNEQSKASNTDEPDQKSIYSHLHSNVMRQDIDASVNDRCDQNKVNTGVKCVFCGDYRNKTYKRFHRFPLDPVISSAAWDRFKVCSDHFPFDAYNSLNRLRLHGDAVPLLNLGYDAPSSKSILTWKNELRKALCSKNNSVDGLNSNRQIEVTEKVDHIKAPCSKNILGSIQNSSVQTEVPEMANHLNRPSAILNSTSKPSKEPRLVTTENKKIKIYSSKLHNLQKKESKIKWMDPDCYNGAIIVDCYNDYTWAQSLKDVDLRIKVAKHITTGKQVKVQIQRNSITTEVLSNGSWETLKKGDLNWHINVEESTWTLIPGEHIHICLQKLQQRWWDSCFVDEPKINLKSIDPSMPFEDLDEESQAKINELMYNEQQKRLGKPTIQQNKIENILKDAWNAEGSPFKGQPYDPSLVNVQNAENL